MLPHAADAELIFACRSVADPAVTVNTLALGCEGYTCGTAILGNVAATGAPDVPPEPELVELELELVEEEFVGLLTVLPHALSSTKRDATAIVTVMRETDERIAYDRSGREAKMLVGFTCSVLKRSCWAFNQTVVRTHHESMYFVYKHGHVLLVTRRVIS